jgi:thiamine biosynthesis lipoprotein
VVRSTAVTLLALSTSLLACASSSNLRFEYRQRHMGTEARIVFYASDSTVARAAAAAAFTRIAEIDGRLSDYRVDSEVSRIAASPAGSVVPVSDDVVFVLSRALDAAVRTDGAFDPTAGAIVALWRDARRNRTLPDPDRLTDALARTGWRNIRLDTAARTVRPAVTGLRLDFGGIAKGWAADQAMVVLRSRGVNRALIDFGGEIVASEAPPGETGWRVRIENGGAGDIVLLSAGAISTSGPTQQFVVIDGVSYSHVVDPRTGIGLTNGRSATVHAPTGWLADLLATAATVVDPDGLRRLRAAWPEAVITIR